MKARTSLSRAAVGHSVPSLRPRPPVTPRKSRQSFDLVLAFAVLGVALISAVALIGDLAYALPHAVSLILWVFPLLALTLVGFAVFGRKRH